MQKRILLMGGAIVCAITVATCGGDSGGSTPAPTPTPTPTPGGTTVTLTSSGASPRDITVTVGSRVTFTNNDNQPHDMASDPHPEHTNCPQINAVGFVSAGQSRQTENLNTARVCTYHDHNQPTNTSLQGTIRIQ